MEFAGLQLNGVLKIYASNITNKARRLGFKLRTYLIGVNWDLSNENSSLRFGKYT